MDQNVYPLFTIRHGIIEKGAVVNFMITGGKRIPVIAVGENARGRTHSVLPVLLSPEQVKILDERGSVMIYSGQVDKDLDGKPYLIAHDAKEAGVSTDKFIGVFRTDIAHGGGNSHSGDKMGVYTPKMGFFAPVATKKAFHSHGLAEHNFTLNQAQSWLTANFPRGNYRFEQVFKTHYYHFPGEKIINAVIAHDGADLMKAGTQFVAVVPKDKWFRIAKWGDLYGAPAVYYYRWDSINLLSMTEVEKEALESFFTDGIPVFVGPAPEIYAIGTHFTPDYHRVSDLSSVTKVEWLNVDEYDEDDVYDDEEDDDDF